MDFDTYKEALVFYEANKDKASKGKIWVISGDGHSVYQRPIDSGFSVAKSEPKSGVYAGYGRDSIGEGVQGILNHADGKKYDSKSQYERALRAKGCRVVGNDWNNATYKTPLERGVRGDFNVRPQLKEAVQKVMGC